MSEPLNTVASLAEAINRGDVGSAIALYEQDAVLVVQPGQLARGTAQLRNALAGFVAMKAQLQSTAQQVVRTADVALYVGRWTLRGTGADGKPIELGGESTDVLRRQEDGRWLIALDNPWGARILPPG